MSGGNSLPVLCEKLELSVKMTLPFTLRVEEILT
jgi:hypothetical protein